MLRLIFFSFQHTPLNDTGGSVSILRQTFIARVSSLKSLNGGEVRSTERSDAEKLYIQRLYKGKLANLEEGVTEQPPLSSFVPTLSIDHPRVADILALHGEPTVRRQGGGGAFLFSYFFRPSALLLLLLLLFLHSF